MSISIFCDAPYGNEDAWYRFVLAHYLRHQTYRSMVSAQVTNSSIQSIIPKDNSWMLLHAQEHLDMANALGLQANPNIGVVDMTVAENYQQWMLQHRDEHANFDLALGLT